MQIRYEKQIEGLQKILGQKAKVVKMSFDGKHLLKNTDVFIGSGGTMTAESALMGVPTISYNAVPNIIEDFLVKKGLVKRETNPKKVSSQITKFFESKKQLVKDLKGVISPQKIIKLKMAEDAFNRELLEKLRKFRENRGSKRDAP